MALGVAAAKLAGPAPVPAAALLSTTAGGEPPRAARIVGRGRGQTPGLPRGRRPATVAVRGCTTAGAGSRTRSTGATVKPQGRSAVVVEPSAPSSQAWKPGGALREYARGRSMPSAPVRSDA